MASTSDTTDAAKPLKTDRRITLDGGINTRASALNLPANNAINLGNFRFKTGGALQKRQGGKQLCTVPPYASVAGIPLPIVEDGGTGGSTIPAGTYNVVYTVGTVSSLTGIIGPTSTPVSITISANHKISVLIPSVNSGEGLGSLSTGTFNDEPQNAGILLSGSNFGIYIQKSGDPNYTLQAFSDLGSTPLGPPPTPRQNGHLFSVGTYGTGGAVAPTAQLAPIPVRALFWHPLIDTLVGVSAETAYALQGALTSPQYMTKSLDSAGNAFGFSRLPTRIASTVVDKCLIMSDAVGRPKILDSPANANQVYGVSVPTSWSFRQLGAAPPSAAPTDALTTGTLNGVYQYVVTFVYQRNRQDGTNFLSESNSSPILNTGSLTSKLVTVTIPAPSESGIVSWNLYRTISGGTQFFLLATTAIATLSFPDSNADTLLTGQQPPDMGGKVPNDIPPYGFAMVTEHAGRAFGVQSNVLRKAGAGSAFTVMTRTRATNVVQYSKARFVNDLVGVGGLITVPPGDFGNIDAWPSIYTFPCGNASSITNITSFRGVLYVFKEDEIGVIEGSTDQDYAYRTIWTGTGAMENSIIQIGNYLLAFDQAIGPIQVSGYSVTDIGYNTIQQDWVDPITYLSGEAVAGGGRGSTGVINSAWDAVQSEARWVMSDFQTNPTSGTATGATPTFFEYVCQVAQGKPREVFTRFTGAGPGPGYTGTSSSNQAFVVIPGNYTFTTQAGLSFVAGNPIIAINASNPANYVTGTVTSYSGTSLVIDVTALVGTFTINSFIFKLNGSVVDRCILAQDKCIVGTAAIPFRSRDMVFGDYFGRLVEDNEVEYDLDGSFPSPINVRATFPFFFGDNPELVKQFRYLYMMFVTGSNTADAINVFMQSLSEGAASPEPIKTVNGSAAAGVNQVQRIDLPPLIDGLNSKDRGMQIVITGSAQSGPLLVEELAIRYQDTGDRSKP